MCAMNDRTIPVLLLTGYLGSGKTTLVNKILSNRRGIKFAVIVNDLGEVNIDADLIQRGGIVEKKDDSLVALQNGCICCTLKVDLLNQLDDIASKGRFDYIVIEASGICEPQPIAQTICSIPSLGDKYTSHPYAKLDSIVTVVDALRMQSEFDCGEGLRRFSLDEDDIENLLIQQIEFCNVILLNKASEVSAQELGRIKGIVRAIQPKARIIECDYCEVDFDEILNTGAFDFDKVSLSAAWLGAIEGEHEGHEHHSHENEEEGEAEEYGIGTFVFQSRKPFDINKFDWFVSKKWPKSIIRAKGICYFTDEPDHCLLFEQAGKQISMRDIGLWYAAMPEDDLAEMMERESGLRKDWDPVYGDRMQKIVFIGQHMDRSAIVSALEDALAEQK